MICPNSFYIGKEFIKRTLNQIFKVSAMIDYITRNESYLVLSLLFLKINFILRKDKVNANKNN